MHSFIVDCHKTFKAETSNNKHGHVETGISIEDNLNNFYVDAVECLCFRNGQRPNNDTIDAILKVNYFESILSISL